MFLLNPIFGNSIRKIQSDLSECSDKNHADFLSRVIPLIERSPISYSPQKQDENNSSGSEAFELFTSNDDLSHAEINGIHVKHSGFW